MCAINPLPFSPNTYFKTVLHTTVWSIFTNIDYSQTYLWRPSIWHHKNIVLAGGHFMQSKRNVESSFFISSLWIKQPSALNIKFLILMWPLNTDLTYVCFQPLTLFSKPYVKTYPQRKNLKNTGNKYNSEDPDQRTPGALWLESSLFAYIMSRQSIFAQRKQCVPFHTLLVSFVWIQQYCLSVIGRYFFS